jgi:hypothetical protein
MKRIVQLIALSIVCFVIIGQVTEKQVYSNIDGVIPKVTGSPFDISGQTCSQTDCHSGGSTALADLITSNVPASGYVPGTVYTITATVTDPNKTRFGFEISPQTSTGALAGTITLTDAVRTKFTVPSIGNKYVTHTLAGTDAPSHTAAWSFNWQAPAEGTGDITVYGCFNFSNRDSSTTGDQIHTATLTIPEQVNGVNDPIVVSSLNIYPNPVVHSLQLDYFLQKSGTVKIDLFDVSGREVTELFHAEQSAGAHHNSFPLNQQLSGGSYLLRLMSGEQTLTKRVMVL